jgi:hypothetical protein
MAKYPTTKILKKATPKVRTADNVVISWDIEVLFTHTRADKTTWSRSYPHTEDVEYLNKTPNQFTKTELLAFMPLMDVIFDAHYEAHNLPPVDERLSNFSLSDLAE